MINSTESFSVYEFAVSGEVFPITFDYKGLSFESIEVFVGTQLRHESDYELLETGNPVQYSVRFKLTHEPAVGERIVIQRKSVIKQPVEYNPNMNLTASQVVASLDRLTKAVQELRDTGPSGGGQGSFLAGADLLYFGVSSVQAEENDDADLALAQAQIQVSSSDSREHRQHVSLQTGVRVVFSAGQAVGYYWPWIALQENRINTVVFFDSSGLIDTEWIRSQNPVNVNGTDYYLFARGLPLENGDSEPYIIRSFS